MDTQEDTKSSELMETASMVDRDFWEEVGERLLQGGQTSLLIGTNISHSMQSIIDPDMRDHIEERIMLCIACRRVVTYQ